MNHSHQLNLNAKIYKMTSSFSTKEQLQTVSFASKNRDRIFTSMQLASSENKVIEVLKKKE